MYYWSDSFILNLCFDDFSSLKWLELWDETSQKMIYHANSQYTKAHHAQWYVTGLLFTLLLVLVSASNVTPEERWLNIVSKSPSDLLNYTGLHSLSLQKNAVSAMKVFELLLWQYAVDLFCFSLDLSKPIYSGSYGWVHQFWLVRPWTKENSWCQLCHLLQPSGWHIMSHFHDQFTCNSDSCCLGSWNSVCCLIVLWKLAFKKVVIAGLLLSCYTKITGNQSIVFLMCSYVWNFKIKVHSAVSST